MRSILAGIRTLTLPYGAPSTVPREVIGVSPIPPELVAFYAGTPPEAPNPPETVVGLTINYDGLGDYGYTGFVTDSASPKPHLSQVAGSYVGGTVNEYARTILNPNIAPSGRVITDIYLNEWFFESNDPTLTLIVGGLVSDTFGRWRLDSAGFMYFGPGGGSDQDTIIQRSAAQVILIDNLIANTAAVGNAPVAETWHAMTLQNSWVNQGGTRVTAQYRRVPSPAKSIELVGAIKNGTITDGTTIATLPAGYRPASTITNVVYCTGTVAGGQSPAFNVDSTGAITCFGLNGATGVNFHFTVPLDA